MFKVTPAIAKKEQTKTARVNKTTTKPDQRDQMENKIPKPFMFVEEEKTEGCQREELTRAYERKMLKDLLSSDPVL